MPILAQNIGADNLNKCYLEQALLAYSVNRPPNYKKKCTMLNEILNRIVRDEVRYGVYTEHVKLSKETFTEIFG